MTGPGDEEPTVDGAQLQEALDPATRRAYVLALVVTALVGGGLTLLVTLQGSGGRAALATLLLGAAVGAAIGALYASATAVIDTIRKRPVARSRVIAAVVLFVLGAVLPGMLVAIGG